jgi:carotenoid cleavage dioxygenase-like enzyme
VPPREDAPQGVGYVLQLVDRHAEARCDLLILDARHIDAEPAATVKLPIRMPGGLHGNWVTADQLAAREG